MPNKNDFPIAVYLDEDFNPVDEVDAVIVKVIQEDGSSSFHKPIENKKAEDRGFNPAEARIPEGHIGGGQWTRGTSVAKLKGLQGRLQTEGGFTYQVMGGSSPRTGEHAMILSPYQAREQKIALADLKPTDLARYVVKNIDKLSKPGHYLGAWHNPEDGQVYLDVSIVVHGHKAARALCEEHKQLAYFDLDHMETVYMPKESKE